MVSLFLCVPHHCHLTERGITDICPFAPNPFQGQRAQKDPQAAAKVTHPTRPFTGQNQHIFFSKIFFFWSPCPTGTLCPCYRSAVPFKPRSCTGSYSPITLLRTKTKCLGIFLTPAGVEKSSQQHKASSLRCFSSPAGITGVSRSISSITGTKRQVKPIPSPISHRGPRLSFC